VNPLPWTAIYSSINFIRRKLIPFSHHIDCPLRPIIIKGCEVDVHVVVNSRSSRETIRTLSNNMASILAKSIGCRTPFKISLMTHSVVFSIFYRLDLPKAAFTVFLVSSRDPGIRTPRSFSRPCIEDSSDTDSIVIVFYAGSPIPIWQCCATGQSVTRKSVEWGVHIVRGNVRLNHNFKCFTLWSL